MEIKVEQKTFRICDFCLKKNRLTPTTMKCILCGKDVCSNDLYSELASNYSDWIPSDAKGLVICKECGEYFEKVKYNSPPKSWKSKETEMVHAFKDIYFRKLEKAKEQVRKEMSLMIMKVFEEVKKKKNLVVIKERKLKELEEKKREIEEEIRKVST